MSTTRAVATAGKTSSATATTNATMTTTALYNAEQESIYKRYHDKHSASYIIRTAAAGGIAGCMAKTVIAPLDRVKILFQASNPKFQKYAGSWLGVFQVARQLYILDGYRGLFQGHSATLIRIFPYAAVKFVAYEQFKHVWILMPTRASENSIRQFVAGSLAGITSVLVTYPLELVRVRLAFEIRKDTRIGLRSIYSQIYSEPAASRRVLFHFPLRNFYRGLLPTIMGMVPYAGVSFLTHHALSEFCRNRLTELTTDPSLVRDKLDGRGQKRRAPLKTWAEMVVGGLSGAIAQTVSYPFEVIRRRMQVYGALDPARFVGIWETTRTIWMQNKFRGFFVGLTIGYLKVTPMVAVSFTVYDRMKLLFNVD
ncbi:3555_t:CDS:2 [Paraglomus brasilianum]|uniref:3555_t:CDS:1 n=1 Tax=Paraglomus brasilianum TaxID=144538 RepID=A0A9N8ZM39_9GLOM|nr:3555_t:CDS:2 [Paraglomus brasilianum]